MAQTTNARRLGPGAHGQVGEPRTTFCRKRPSRTQGTSLEQLSSNDWISVIDLTDRIFGRPVAAALYHQSPLPAVSQLPLLESRFLEERVVMLTYGSLPAAELFEVYVDWCRENCCEPLSILGFGRAMTKLGLERRKSSRSIYRHIALRGRS
jgi:hypothetical protein